MREQFFRILQQYGRPAAVHQGGTTRIGPAMIQPILDKDRQWLPTPLGRRRQDRFLYLGEPGLAMDCLGEDGYVEWDADAYEVISARPVTLGGETIYWWAVLQPRERETAGGIGAQQSAWAGRTGEDGGGNERPGAAAGGNSGVFV